MGDHVDPPSLETTSVLAPTETSLRSGSSMGRTFCKPLPTCVQVAPASLDLSSPPLLAQMIVPVDVTSGGIPGPCELTCCHEAPLFVVR